MRLALGAGRFRIVRQLFTESLCLAGLGGLLGLSFAVAAGPVVLQLALGDDPHITQSSAPDLTILLFSLGVTTICGLFFGLAPAWQSVRADLMRTIGSNRSVAGTRLFGRKVLLTMQIALTLFLLAGAALFMRTLQNLKATDLGLVPERMLQMTMQPKNAGYKDDQITPFLERVFERLRSVPGVRSASAAVMPVMTNAQWGSGIKVEGKPTSPTDRGPDRNAVGADYFTTMGIPLLRGRDFSDRDHAAAPKVAIVNEAFARHYFGDENPIGHRIDQHRGPNEAARFTIVGVAQDGRYRGPREQPTRYWYIPLAQSDLRSMFTLYVRTAGDPAKATSEVRRAIAEVDASVALLNVRTLEEQIASGQRFERMIAVLASCFGVVAALLAAIGIYGVLSYLVNQRQREIGIRLALGATPASVAGLVVSGIAGWVALGIALALPAVYWGASAARNILYEVGPTDPTALLAAGGILAAVALVSALLPARRAAAVQPAIALRGE